MSAWKNPSRKRRAQEGLNEGARQSARIKSELGQAFGIGKRNPVDPFHRHHFARGAAPIDRRRAYFRVLPGILGKFRRRCGFEPEVHLDAHRARERLDDLNEAQPSKLRRQAVDDFGGEKHVGQVARKPPFDAGAQHFHRHRPHALAGFHVGAVDLGDRSRRDRLAEVLEQGIDLPAERGLDNADRGLTAHRSNTVLQALEIEGDLRSDDIGTSRQELPELDVGRSQPVDRPGEAGQPVDVALGDEVCQAQRQARDGRQQRRIDTDERPFAREHIARVHEPQAMAERRHDRHNQSFQPE